MGFTRKLMSVSTAGLVDFRSDKERTAAYTRGTRKQARKQTKLIQQQTALMAAQAAVSAPAAPQFRAAAPAPAIAPPPAAPRGWYPDPGGAPIQRYWDGAQWTQARSASA